MRGGARSARYILLSTIASKVFLLFTGIILSRILSLEDFGYLLTLNIIFGLANLFSISGYEYFYIQQTTKNKDSDLQLLRQVFHLRIVQTIIVFSLLIAASAWLYLYHDQTLAKMLALSAFIFPAMLISKPEETWLSKQLDYSTISSAGFARDIVSGSVKVISAIAGAGALAFSIGNLAGSFFYSGYIKIRRNLHLFKNSSLRAQVVSYPKIQRFSFHLFLNTAGGFLIKQMDKVLVASFFPRDIRGLYEFSGRYAAYPFNTLISPQTPMVLSLMAKHQKDIDYLLKLFQHYSYLAIGLLLPFFVYSHLYADILIEVIFGPKWLPATTLLRIFILYYAVRVLFYPANGLLTSQGHPQIKARITIAGAIITAGALLFLVRYGFEVTYYAFAFVSIGIVTDLICIIKGLKLVKRSSVKFFNQRIKLCLPLAGYFVLTWGFRQLSPQWPPIVQLAGGLMITILFISIFLRVFADQMISAISILTKNSKIIRFMMKIKTMSIWKY